MNILVVAAHPDDEVLGCGGTIARLSNERNNIFLAILGEGITARYKKRKQVKISLLKSLYDQTKKVSKMLGVKKLFTYNLPDNRFDTVPLLDIVKIIEHLIKKVSPDTIYTHNSSDLNIDHQITNRAVLISTRPAADQKVSQIYAFEIPSSTEWTFQSLGQSFRANVFVDISKYLDAKIKAMNYYVSEMRPFPHPRSKEALISIAKRWGSVSGVNAAEAFELIRLIK